ncbi:uncharacterized protein LOC135493986 isoform X2 [Lineus longissimus]|uniref:uncharacterized protein LOC135493986 isoform X2 n=1 Tax=Lineus longissimus TaxID=88925 RepID=UPI00315D786E
MSFGLSTTPTYRIRAMSANPKFPVKPEDTDDHCQYAVQMQGRLGLKSAIEPRRARSASPRQSRASIEIEMMKIAAQRSKPPPPKVGARRIQRCQSQNIPRDFRIGQATPKRKCHSAKSLRSAEQTPAPPRRPRSAMTPSATARVMSPGNRSTPSSSPLRPKTAFAPRMVIGNSSETVGTDAVRGGGARSVTFLDSNDSRNEDFLSHPAGSARKESSDVSEQKKSGISGMWSRGIDLVRKKSTFGDVQRKPTGGKFLELVLKMRDGGSKIRRSLYLRPFERFQRMAHTVKLIMRFCIHLKKCASNNTKEEWSFMEYHLNLEAELNQLMAFRMEQFTNRKTGKDRGSEKLKQLLALEPEMRTDRDIYIISALIKTNEAFQEYPNWMQQKLCRQFYYRSFEARRVIYKEGHAPHYFYILLTGTVMMNVREYNKKKDKTFSHTISQVKEGQSFGEHAMLADTRRVTTAICKTDVELLVLHQRDFNEIVKIPLQTQKENHVRYVMSMELFRDFPRELLEDRSNMRNFCYQYFKKGTVVVKNNRNYKFLVIIKSGRCSIVVEYKNALKKVMAEMPKLTEEDEELFPLMCDRIRHLLQEKASHMTLDLKRDHVRGLMMKSLMPDMAGLAKKIALERERRNKGIADDNLWEVLDETRASNEFDRGLKKLVDEKKEELLTPFSIGAAVARMGAGVSARRKKEEEASMARELVQTGNNRGSDAKKEEEQENAKWSGMSIYDLPGEYAKVATLEAGAVFGLETLFDSASYEAELPLILASEGAECLIMSKKLFLNGANARVLQVVSDMVVGWPSVEFVGQKIKEQRDWQAYKQYVIKDVMKHTQRKSRAMSAHI